MSKPNLEYLARTLKRLEIAPFKECGPPPSSQRNRASHGVVVPKHNERSAMTAEKWSLLGQAVEASLTLLKADTEIDGIRWLEELRHHVHLSIRSKLRGALS